MSCIRCNKDPQLSVVIQGCGDAYCYLCLKDWVSTQNPANGGLVCICTQPLPQGLDIQHISRDFRKTLTDLNGKNVWLYSSNTGDGWWMYNIGTSNIIESSHSSGLPTCSFLIGSKTYRIEFNSLIQTLVSPAPADPSKPQRRRVMQVKFTNDKIKELNIKGISGVFFEKIENEIGKFLI